MLSLIQGSEDEIEVLSQSDLMLLLVLMGRVSALSVENVVVVMQLELIVGIARDAGNWDTPYNSARWNPDPTMSVEIRVTTATDARS